ncbi:MAG: SRPBCC domain-containing protein [Actinomycetota bacterium]
MSTIEPIRTSVAVKADPTRAFAVFTERLQDWWPFERHSRAASDFEGQGVEVERLEFQGRVGGRVLEHLSNGEVLPWGEVLEWEPPARFTLAWHPSFSERPPTELEVRFTPQGSGTLVELEHRGWERLGEIAEEARAGYGTGWILVLARYEGAVQEEVA